jgi:hypothetical protein
VGGGGISAPSARHNLWHTFRYGDGGTPCRFRLMSMHQGQGGQVIVLRSNITTSVLIIIRFRHAFGGEVFLAKNFVLLIR